MIVNSADDAIQASHIIEQAQFGGVTEKLRTHIVKLPGEKHTTPCYTHIYPRNILLFHGTSSTKLYMHRPL